MIRLKNFFIFFIISILPSIQSQKPINCNRSCAGGQFNDVPYPFGFSAGCEIRLNCTSNGTVLIGGFSVQQFKSHELLVSLPAKCGRAVDALRLLYGQHYAPLATNAILMENCTEQMKNCMIPMTMLRTHLDINCGGVQDGYGNVSCYSGGVARMFLDYENMTRTGCRFLFSSVATEMIGKSTAISLAVQMVRLGWWIPGTCNCYDHAVCKTIVSPDGSDGFRCECRNGFDGDGYKASSGCRKREEKPHRKLRLILVLALIVGAMVTLIVIILCLRMTLIWRTKAKNDVNEEIFLKNHEFLAPKRYSYLQVKKMTNSFRVKLGQGGFGSVYRGALSNENLVAVKVLNGLKGKGEDFVNEVASVGRTSHVNIVSLVGFCLEGRHKALIYEFMPNGSLEKFIYGWGSSSNSHLGWGKLLQIAIGIARGLEYLHRGCNTRILHFDIKPHNILLDKDLCPKISDFGLSKLFPNGGSMISMSCMRGTPGYIAPELFSRNFGQVSHKSDVYSYGMMILEMVGGRKNIEVEVDHTSEIYFPHWIYKKVELHDEKLGLYGIMNDEENEMARKMIIVGLWCIQTNPLSRPTITKVLEMLEGDLASMEIPPKPYLSSPSRPVGSSSTS
ncbi:hypothetical protein L6452_18116 [Arctium lappa]|uniref:Uncharacterized protein n=1 Tax=Arctium lappa TaxID=4217 RepID=A0ACB9C593_ARCLA|nr:hypothetical protein L6452_18116 [Arctium lappa]